MPITVQCGSCKKRLTAKEKLAGRKVKCPQCGAVLTIPEAGPTPQPGAAPRSASTRPTPSPVPKAAPPMNDLLDEIPLAATTETMPGPGAGMDNLLDEIPLASPPDAASAAAPASSPSTGVKCPSCEASMEPGSVLCTECGYNTLTRKKREVSGPKKGGSSGPWVRIGVIAGILIFLVVVVFFAFTLFQPSTSVGVAASGITETPNEFAEVEFGEEDYRCEHPKGWEVTNGGGKEGVPPWTKSEKGGASVQIRDSMSGTESGMLWRALKQRSDIERGEAPVEKVHEHRKQFVVKDMRNYEESTPEKLVHPIGDALISEFTAKPMLGAPVRGYRATVLHEYHQFNILCVCTESEWEILKPAFEHVIASLKPIEKEEFPGVM